MDFIAVDPPIVVITRLIESVNRVSNCGRQKNESLSSFVSRFSSLASDHLIHAGASPNSNVGEVLAITLLEHANLHDTTHQSAKMQLINATKMGNPDANSAEDKRHCELDDSDCEKLQSVYSSLEEAIETLDTALAATGRANSLANATAPIIGGKSGTSSMQRRPYKEIFRPSSSIRTRLIWGAPRLFP